MPGNSLAKWRLTIRWSAARRHFKRIAARKRKRPSAALAALGRNQNMRQGRQGAKNARKKMTWCPWHLGDHGAMRWIDWESCFENKKLKDSNTNGNRSLSPASWKLRTFRIRADSSRFVQIRGSLSAARHLDSVVGLVPSPSPLRDALVGILNCASVY